MCFFAFGTVQEPSHDAVHGLRIAHPPELAPPRTSAQPPHHRGRNIGQRAHHGNPQFLCNVARRIDPPLAQVPDDDAHARQAHAEKRSGGNQKVPTHGARFPARELRPALLLSPKRDTRVGDCSSTFKRSRSSTMLCRLRSVFSRVAL